MILRETLGFYEKQYARILRETLVFYEKGYDFTRNVGFYEKR